MNNSGLLNRLKKFYLQRFKGSFANEIKISSIGSGEISVELPMQNLTVKELSDIDFFFHNLGFNRTGQPDEMSSHVGNRTNYSIIDYHLSQPPRKENRMKPTTQKKLRTLIERLIKEETGDLSMPFWVIEIGGNQRPDFGEGYDGKYPIIQTFGEKSQAQKFVAEKRKLGNYGISYRVVSANRSKLK